MHGCQGCRDNLLDFLYDLLDEAETQRLREHLAGCAACQAHLAQAHSQQKLLAAAARAHFPGVTFTPPTEQGVQPASGVRAVLLPRKPTLAKPRVQWQRWALAASVLLAIAGIGIPAGILGRDYAAARRIIRDHDNTVADARKTMEAAQQEINAAAREHERRVDEIQQDVRARGLRMEVQGPHTVQAGAPAEFLVHTYDLNNNPVAAEITTALTGFDQPRKQAGRSAESITTGGDDKKGKAEETAVSPTVREVKAGTYQVSIPPSLRLDHSRPLGMTVAAKRKDDKRQVSLQGTLHLTAPVYLTHLTTDKPMYQPGEMVRFRSLTVDRATMKPANQDFRLVYTLLNPNGESKDSLRGGNGVYRGDDKGQWNEIKGPDNKPIRGVGVGEFPLPDDAPGGEWTLSISDEYARFPTVTRKFTVNRYQKPNLDKKLDFNKPTYGEGDEVSARVTAKRADAKAVANRRADITVTVDDQIIGIDGSVTGKPFSLQTDHEGVVVPKFELPAKIERGQASLAVTFHDDSAIETIVRTIPVVLKKVNLEFYPEGGDLISGLDNRVYFSARTPLGKPAQVSATLLVDGVPQTGVIETLSDEREPGVNQGHGVFSLTPVKGKKYSLRIDTPAGVTQRFDLPEVRDDGVVLRVPEGVFQPEEPLRAFVLGAKSRSLLVGAYCRGQLLDLVRLEKNQTEAVLRPASGAGGVCRITVFEELPGRGQQRQLRPLAERLVYRHPKERVDLELTTERKSHVPGDKVKMSLSSRTEEKKLTPAVVMLAVVDKSVTTLADEKTYRTMPTNLLLTSEVQRADDLEYADFLVGKHPKAPRSLDLLLGTQGWRRFAEQSPEQFRDRMAKATKNLPETQRRLNAEDTERLLVLIGQSTPRTTDFDQQVIERTQRDFDEKAEGLQTRFEEAATAETEALQAEAYKEAQSRMVWHQNALTRAREAAMPMLGVLLSVLVLLALAQWAGNRGGLAGITASIAVLCGLLLVGVWTVPVGMSRQEDLTKADGDAFGDMRADIRLGHMKARPFDIEPEMGTGKLTPLAKEDAAFAAPQAALAGGGAPPPAPMAPPVAGGIGAVLPQPVQPPPPGPMPGFGAPGGPVPPLMPAPKVALREGGKAAMPGAPGGFGGFGGPKAKGTGAGAMPKVGGDADKKDGAADGKEGKGGEGKPGQALDAGPQMQFKKQVEPFGGRGGKGGGGGRDAMDMARRLRGKDKDAEFMEREKGEAAPLTPFLVREYAHKHTTAKGAARSDFAETLAWHPVLVLADGKGEVSFDLCDSVTTFEAVAFAHTLDGRLGAVTTPIEARLPFTLSPKVPLEVTATDRLDIPLGIANNTSEKRQVQLALTAHDGLKLIDSEREAKLELPGDGRARRVFSFRPSLVEGKAAVRFEGSAGPFRDGVQHAIRVVPDGFPITGSASDLLEKSATHKIKLPPTWIAGTLKARVDVYPSTLADLQKGLEGLLGEPHGCFEQSSTANYPNVLILDYLRTVDKADPQMEKRIRELLDRGYQKLTSYECQPPGGAKKGYEWFGGTAPPHEALTAYGLLQFRDMARVHEVDAAMLKRTKEYLLGQRDGKGGFERNARALDSFGRAPAHITNAYIVWALSEAAPDEDLSKELKALQEKDSDDPYYLSLVALALANRGKSSAAEAILKKVAKAQKGDGHLDATETSITGSGGTSLAIEATALSVLAWLKTNPAVFDRNIREAVKWIGQQRGGAGSFGSTQSTILALKALIAHAKANKRTPEAGELRLFVGETMVGKSLAFPAGVDQPLTLELTDAEKHLKPGDNTVRVEITGAKNVFPHTMSWSYRTTKPNSAAKVPVKLNTSLAKNDLSEGESVRLTVRVENTTGKGQGMAVAIVGLPAGLSLPEDLKQLKEYCRLGDEGKRPTLSAFEVIGRELVLYWRDLDKGETISVPVDVVARVPGEYRGPASRSYLYYNAEAKDWVEPLSVRVQAK